MGSLATRSRICTTLYQSGASVGLVRGSHFRAATREQCRRKLRVTRAFFSTYEQVRKQFQRLPWCAAVPGVSQINPIKLGG